MMSFRQYHDRRLPLVFVVYLLLIGAIEIVRRQIWEVPLLSLFNDAIFTISMEAMELALDVLGVNCLSWLCILLVFVPGAVLLYLLSVSTVAVSDRFEES